MPIKMKAAYTLCLIGVSYEREPPKQSLRGDLYRVVVFMYLLGKKTMVKVTIDLSELEIEMLLHCLESAIDVKHMQDKDIERAKEIKEQLSQYL